MLTDEQLAAFRERFPRLPSLGSEWRTEIIAAPDDHALRVVYADWLIERGDPMGELIQVQCQLWGSRVRRPELVAHEAELLSRVVVRERRWRTLRGWIKHEIEALGGTACVIDRGFVGECTIAGSLPAQNVQQLFALTPLRVLHVDRADRHDVAALAKLLVHGKVLELIVRSDPERPIDDASLAKLAKAPPVARLRRLVIAGGAFGPTGVAAVLDARLTELRALGFQNIRVKPLGGDHWSQLPNLERLQLHSCQLGAAAIQEIAAARLDQLVELDLSFSAIGIRGAQALAKAQLPKLAILRLEHASLNAGQLETIVRGPGLPALREIDLGADPVPAHVARLLASRAKP